jgi:hypothetical protein
VVGAAAVGGLAVGGEGLELVGLHVHGISSGGWDGGDDLGNMWGGRAAAGELDTRGAAAAAPVQLDAVGTVDDGLDGAASEQDSGPVAGAVDIEHVGHGTTDVDR